MRIRLDPANLHENGKNASSGVNASAFVPFVTGGSGEGYWNVGTLSRYVFTTSSTRARIRYFSNEATRVSLLPATNTMLTYLVNSEKRHAEMGKLGDNWTDWFHLSTRGSPTNKRIDVFTPIQNAIVFGQAPTGVWPIEIEFDGDATIVAPLTTGAHWVILGDSILNGMFARTPLDSAVQIAKLGASDSTHRLYQGSYSAGTTYLPKQTGDDTGQIVLYTDGFTYEKISSAAAGTTPVAGSDWKKRGFVGRVTYIGWGTRRWIDDVGSAPLITLLVAQLVALNPTIIGCLRGVNDHAQGSITVASVQAGLTSLLNSLAASALSAVPVKMYGPIIASAFYEGANALSETLDQMRAGIAAAVSATTHLHASYTNLKSVLTTADLVDVSLHPGTTGHYTLYTSL